MHISSQDLTFYQIESKIYVSKCILRKFDKQAYSREEST